MSLAQRFTSKPHEKRSPRFSTRLPLAPSLDFTRMAEATWALGGVAAPPILPSTPAHAALINFKSKDKHRQPRHVHLVGMDPTRSSAQAPSRFLTLASTIEPDNASQATFKSNSHKLWGRCAQPRGLRAGRKESRARNSSNKSNCKMPIGVSEPGYT